LTPTSKLLGLDRRKMSKSYGNAIFLTDTDKEIDNKVGQMITDPQRARKTDPGDPEICNVFSFHEIYTDEKTCKEIKSACKSAEIGCVQCKKMMAEGLKEGLAPIRAKRKELENRSDKVKEIIKDGNERARAIAEETMNQVREAVKI